MNKKEMFMAIFKDHCREFPKNTPFFPTRRDHDLRVERLRNYCKKKVPLPKDIIENAQENFDHFIKKTLEKEFIPNPKYYGVSNDRWREEIERLKFQYNMTRPRLPFWRNPGQLALGYIRDREGSIYADPL